MHWGGEMTTDERTRKVKQWREANKEDIDRRAALFKAAYSALCDRHGLRINNHYEELIIEDITQDGLGPIWVASGYF